MLENKSWVSCTPMWYILVLPRWCIPVDLCLEYEDKMILRMGIIRYICRLNCASFLPRLRKSGSELGWDLDFKLGFSVGMVLGSRVEYPL